jgi:hypothetical protein
MHTVNDLRLALVQNKWLEEILGRFDEIDLPDNWLAAGCIAQTIWNLRSNQPPELGIKDVDLIYFDAQDLSGETEAGHERRLRYLFRDLPIKLDVKNEARVHLWYKDRFGYAIKPYSSCADAIATFPTTATSVGIRGVLGKFECCAPFGLDDLFGLVVRPNRMRKKAENVARYWDTIGLAGEMLGDIDAWRGPEHWGTVQLHELRGAGGQGPPAAGDR